MHSFHADRYTIHHSSDLSGDCIIVDHQDERELRVPGKLLLDFVAQYVVGERIAKLEQAGTAEILGLAR